MKVKKLIVFVFLSIILLPVTVSAEDGLLEYLDEITPDEMRQEDYYTMVDEQGRELMVTGRRIFAGDSYLDEDNYLYRVERVKGKTAYAVMMEKVELASPAVVRTSNIIPVEAPSRCIGVYHTHNDESYLPEDGTESIYGRGGIHDVGASFRETLESKGIQVIHDQTLHLPHDRSAYRRSRPTAEELLEERPDVIFDIHRDATQPEFYQENVDGMDITQIRIVVGRANPNMWVNRQFAFDLKGYADDLYPGLVKGVFMAQGDYNQDLTPLNLLLEVGSHTNSKLQAEEGASLFADVVAYYFYGPEGERNSADAEQRENKEALPPARRGGQYPGAVGWTIFGVLTALALGLFGFLMLNAESPRQAWEDLRDWSYRAWQWFSAELPQILAEAGDRAAQALVNAGQAVEVWVGRQLPRLREAVRSFIAAVKGLLRQNKV